MERMSREDLIAEGWEERFSASGRRLDEVVSYYRSLGYEVKVVELEEAAEDDSCIACFSGSGVEGPVGLVFTRAGSAPMLEEEGLFGDEQDLSQQPSDRIGLKIKL